MLFAARFRQKTHTLNLSFRILKCHCSEFSLANMQDVFISPRTKSSLTHQALDVEVDDHAIAGRRDGVVEDLVEHHGVELGRGKVYYFEKWSVRVFQL
jgi:hypothetical protein